jgi:hypothetical protein
MQKYAQMQTFYMELGPLVKLASDLDLFFTWRHMQNPAFET